MSNQLAIIEQKLTSPEVATKMSLALNIAPGDEDGINKAKKYAYSVLAQVKKTQGDKNGDLTTCNPDSIVQTMIDAAHMQVAIDGRQHAHLIKYGNSCTLQMGYRGYLAKIKEHYPDADFVVEPVYSGDKIEIWNENGIQKYTHKKAGAFRSGEKDFIGILFAVTYTDNGRLIQRVVDVPKERIDRAKGAAKQKYVWNSDYIEKAKAAAIKNACKTMFASIQGLQDIVGYDNEKNYNAGTMEATPARNSIIDNINSGNAPQESQQAEETPQQHVEPEETEETPQQPENGIIDADFIDVEPEQHDPAVEQELVAAGDAASSNGVAAYKNWIATLSESQKDIVRSNHQAWQAKAKEVTAAQQQPANEPPADNDAPPI